MAGATASELADKLCRERRLSAFEYAALISERTPAVADALAAQARDDCARVYGDAVYVRGLIEFTNFCRNNCLYCGIRKGNRGCRRYRLGREQVLACARAGYDIGMRTFVLQGGEDPLIGDDWLCGMVRELKRAHPNCAVTLSVGERPDRSYRALREAGADRYLLRHESANPEHYRKLHPSSMLHGNRMRCLGVLRDAGFTVGAGFMVGSPFQTPDDIAADLKFIEGFKPEMCGIGPFVPHHATPFASFPGGTLELTCFLLSIIRIIQPDILLPATTALATIDPQGYEKGILSGANVIMPNLSPLSVRGDYELYDGKVCSDGGNPEGFRQLGERMESIGRRIVVGRGDPAKIEEVA